MVLSMRDHKEGKRTQPFFEKNEHEQHTMRIAKQPAKDVAHIAYWHTPEISAANGVSFINKAHIDQNIVDHTIKESLMIADERGELHYAEIKGKDDYQIKSPGNRLPSRDIAVTNQFHGDFPDSKNALYYRVEIDYHYDAMPYNGDEDFLLKPYEGREIEIVDLLGRPLHDVIASVYTQAIKGYPHMRRIVVLLASSDDQEVICIKYNHVSALSQKHDLIAVRNKVELYTSKLNTLEVKGKTKQMMESGFVRIINLRSFMQPVDKMALKKDDEYSIEELTDGKGFSLTVAPKREKDPRKGEVFSYSIEATYHDKFGAKVKKSTGLLFDYTLNKADILPNEKNRYRGTGKTIGMIEGLTILSAREMLHKSLPMDASSIPGEAVLTIKDGNGSLLYYEKIKDDNNKIDTLLDESGFAISHNKKESGKWAEGIKPNNLLDEIPQAHRFSIIPEHQANQWAFGYAIDGTGKIPYKVKRSYDWRIRAYLGITTQGGAKAVQINDPKVWEAFGEADVLREMICAECGETRSDHEHLGGVFIPSEEYVETLQNTKDLWRLEQKGINGASSLSYHGNHEDLIGFYNKFDENGRDLINDLTDYEFSTVVEITDRDDDDAIGIMFRLRDPKNYYMFIWEKDTQNTEAMNGLGVGRVFLGTEGYTHYKYSTINKDYRYTDNMNRYLDEMGYGKRHKRLLRATPSNLPKDTKSVTSPNGTVLYPDFKYGKSQFPIDKTGTTFKDITLDSGVSTEAAAHKGWEINKKYRITVQITGNQFAVYINEGAFSSELGELVLEGEDPDNVHTRGTYGITVLSQVDVNWSDMKLTEYTVDTVDSPTQTTELSSQGKKLLLNQKVDVFMDPYIKSLFVQGGKYEGSSYVVTSYRGVPEGNLDVEVHQNSRNVYGRPLDDDVGKEGYNDWSTRDEDPELSLVGTGTVTFRDDGSFIIKADHKTIPEIKIPEHVEQFKWLEPRITTGENVSVRRRGKTLYFDATRPAIKEIGKVLHVEEQWITAKEGLKNLFSLSEQNIYELFSIPEHIPLNEIALRIEKGRLLPNSNRSEAPTPAMNYRFRVKREEVYKLVVDQSRGYEGDNRLRLSQVYAANSKYIDPTFTVDVVGWITQPLYQTIPVYAVKIRNDYHIMAHPPRIDGTTNNINAWLPTVTNGKLLKRITLPEVIDDGKTQLVYERYPQLKQFASTPDKLEEVEVVYGVPEYERMHFVRDGVKAVDQEVPRFITDRILQTKNPNIITDDTKETPHHKVTAIKGNSRVDIPVRDIDSKRGLIFLREPLDEENEPLVSYSYRETDYTYPGFVNTNSTLAIKSAPYPIKGTSYARLKVKARNEYPTDPPWYVMLAPTQKHLNIRRVGDELVVRIQLRDHKHLDNYTIKLDNQIIEQRNNLPFDVTRHDAKEIRIPLKKEKLHGDAKVDIVFLLDVTGSMVSSIEKIRSQIFAFVTDLQNEQIDWRAGVVMYGDGMMGDYNNNRPYRTVADDLNNDLNEIINSGGHMTNDTGSVFPPRELRKWGTWGGRSNGGENTFEAIFDDEYGATSYDTREHTKKHVIILSDERPHTKESVGDRKNAKARYTLREALDAIAATDYVYYLIYDEGNPVDSTGFKDMIEDPRINALGERVFNSTYNFRRITQSILDNIKLKEERYRIDVSVQNKAGISHEGTIDLHLEDLGGIAE